jgi:hypothetical protein
VRGGDRGRSGRADRRRALPRILITLRYWAHQPYKLLTVRSKVQSRFWELLEREDVDVEIAYPHQQLRVDEDDPLAVRMTGAGDGEAVPVSDGEASPGPDADPGAGPP